MSFTPNMISFEAPIQFEVSAQWAGKLLPQGVLPTSVEIRDDGTVAVNCQIRYDYGPYEDAGNTGPAFAFLSDRLLVKTMPSGEGLAYTERAAPLGVIQFEGAEHIVYVYVERDIMCISTPGEDESESRSYHRVVDLPLTEN